MALSESDYKLFDRVNKALTRFEKQNIKNNISELIKNELLNIYMQESTDNPENAKLNKINWQRFTKSDRTVSPETLDKLRALAEYADNTKSLKLSYYKDNPEVDERIKKAFATAKEKDYEVNTFSDFVRLKDDVENAMKNEIIAKHLSSDDVAILYGYGKRNNMTPEEIDNLIVKSVKKFNNHDSLYKWLIDDIDGRHKKIKKKKKG